MIEYFLNLGSYYQPKFVGPQQHPLNLEELAKVFPPSLAQLEFSKQKQIPIPKEVLAIYATYRPTPLFRARKFEQAIHTSCEIYLKDEGVTPTRNHKANSAYFIAYLCKRDGVKLMTTETTGNWGIALALAAKAFDIELICFMDSESHSKRPDRKTAMEDEAAKVIVAHSLDSQVTKDLLTLSADAAIEYTKQLPGAYYIFGSVYNYFVTPQSVIGLEAKQQLMALEPVQNLFRRRERKAKTTI